MTSNLAAWDSVFAVEPRHNVSEESALCIRETSTRAPDIDRSPGGMSVWVLCRGGTDAMIFGSRRSVLSLLTDSVSLEVVDTFETLDAVVVDF